jgi:hypothetical protein
MLDQPASGLALWALYDKTGLLPCYVLPTFQAESGMNPAAVNKGSGAVGLNQILPSYLPSGVDATTYATWPASQQIAQVITPFISNTLASLKPTVILSGTRFYQSNLLPATVNGTAGWKAARYPADVVVSKSGPTNQNAADYAGKKGYISVADLEAFVRKTLPSIQSTLTAVYALRPTETMTDPVIGTDPYLQPGAQPPGGSSFGTNVALAVGGSLVILGTSGLIAWALTASRYR